MEDKPYESRRNRNTGNATGGAVYGLGFIGAAIYLSRRLPDSGWAYWVS